MGLLERLGGLIHVKHLKQCLAHSQKSLPHELTAYCSFLSTMELLRYYMSPGTSLPISLISCTHSEGINYFKIKRKKLPRRIICNLVMHRGESLEDVRQGRVPQQKLLLLLGEQSRWRISAFTIHSIASA